ncbi:uncharacterized protein F4807DRAFT_415550 [Annulohypoxylon truncatum]|uniref:uncharacterized protein n=1 Tax=Annulohypoxylon truncatum TaxID=327061 RepID=UPI0020076549|nr:uncharacterized protein F4807DRAFT_415550 [Annulohypoxylon truncatum]KAI1212308.1 hypothetical protein F4807DRAFT_415550 [Annulohypoxylon truncatum]
MAPQNLNPPSLPPTVEEAYRRKCIQLKERTKEIEEEAKAYQLRLSRLQRQVQKLRLERAFLLEQVAKRTSTNVEDSEGSPSPPPTPKDKPLRTKRGHRKPSLLPVSEPGTNPSATFISQNLTTLSPSSDAFSHSQLDTQKEHGRGGTNGVAKRPKRPSNAFEIYCNDTRPILQAQNKEKIAAGEFRLEEELARGWKDLPEKEKEEFQIRYEQELAQYKEAVEEFKRGNKDVAARERSRGRDSLAGGSKSSRGGAGARSARFEEVQDEDMDEDQDVEMAEPGDAEPAGDQDTDPETEVEENDGVVD